MSDAAPHDARSGTPSRRGFVLTCLGAVVTAGGAGAAAALLKHHPKDAAPATPQTPAVLGAAVAAETRLIAAIDAADDPTALAHLRADHVAHREALQGAVQLAGGTPAVIAPVTSPTLTLTQLAQVESAASTAAAAAALQLVGRDAALLASIAACEASHAELLR